jgi:hypothetical protein
VSKASKHAPRVSPHCERLARNIYEPRSHVRDRDREGLLTTWDGARNVSHGSPSRSLSSTKDEGDDEGEPALACNAARDVQRGKRGDEAVNAPRRDSSSAAAAWNCSYDGLRRLFAPIVAAMFLERSAGVEHK